MGSRATLEAAISTASTVTNAVAQSIVDAAVSTLNAAITTYDGAIVPTDTTDPVITLNGNANVTITVGDAYTDAGATAADNIDGDLTSSIITTGSVDNSTVGTYTLTYNVSDAAGNPATPITRTVHVEAIVVPDTTAPVITLIGASDMTLAVGDTYTELGATALDNIDGSVTVGISGTVDTATAGDHVITYTATDAASNTATETRTVHVE